MSDEKKYILVELGGILYPPEDGVIAGEICFAGEHRPMGMREYLHWKNIGDLPHGVQFHSLPRKVKA